MAFRPIGKRILIKPLPKDEKSKGGIFIPDTVKDIPLKGLVKKAGELIKPEIIKEEDTVLYKFDAGMPMEVDGENCLLMFDDDILAVL